MLNIDLQHATAVITGGASGIGLATARTLTGAGARCTVLDKEVPFGEENITSIQVDLADLDQLENCMRDLREVDILINNAGVHGRPLLLEETPLSHLEHSWAVNLRAPLIAAKALIPEMKSRGGGVIINISSIAGLRGSGVDPVYAALKAGLLGLTKSLSKQYGPFGIRSVAICPGSVGGTPFLKRSRGYDLTREETIGLLQRLPLRRVVTPENVANLVAFLVSPLAARITGVAVTIDAGELSMSDLV